MKFNTVITALSACLFSLLSGCASQSTLPSIECITLDEMLSQAPMKSADVSIQSESSLNWEAGYNADTDENGVTSVDFTFNKKLNTAKSQRPRLQVNLYNLPKTTYRIDSTFDLTLADYFGNVLSTNTEFEWLTILELWSSPAWVDGESAEKITLGLKKHATQDYFTPFIYSATKHDNVWLTDWERNLEFSVRPEITYKFNLITQHLELADSNILLEVVIRSDEDSKALLLSKHANFIDFNQRFFWGINPIKFYSGNELMTRIASNSKTLSINYSNTHTCIHITN